MQEVIRVAVCDDIKEDRNALIKILSDYLDKNNLYVEIDEFPSGEAFLASDTTRYQLVFMDIFMDKLNGMETAKKLIRDNNKVQIVFAAEAFTIEALHYIVKPIEETQVYGVLDKFFDSFYSIKTIEVKVGRMEESIYISDILYIEAKGKKRSYI